MVVGIARTFDENDGRAPDTDALLKTVHPDSSIIPLQSQLPTSLPTKGLSKTPNLPLSLQSYRWSAPNSCFWDHTVEVMFQCFLRWTATERTDLMRTLSGNHHSLLATLCYHFEQRIKVTQMKPSKDRDVKLLQTLDLAQLQVRGAIFDKWKLYPNMADYGDAFHWIVSMIKVNFGYAIKT